MAADHDETVFDRAEQFDIFRDDLKIAPAWGRGIHMCVGRVLAHMEGEIALDTLLDRIPDLELVGDGGRSYTPQLMMPTLRSEEHTSELQSLMRNSYAVFCLKKK